MKTSLRQLFLGAAIACFFTLTLVALAQEPKKDSAPPATPEPPAPAASAPAPAPAAAAPAAEPAKSAEPAATAAPDEKKEPELRRVDQPTPPSRRNARPNRGPAVHMTHHNGNERVAVANDIHLGPGESADALVAIAGSATSEGEVADAVVSIMGNSSAKTGSVGDAVVSVMGNTYVNTKIGGDAIAVMGDVELGPDAEIGGEVVSVGGTVRRDAGAVVHGSVQNVALAKGLPKLGGLQIWFRECLLMGRPLAFKEGLGFIWDLTLAFFALYVVLALIFGRAVENCATTLETRPGGSLLAALLTILLTPVLIVLLCITIVGIAVVPFLVLALFITALFGKAVMLAWVGRRFTKFFGEGALRHAAMATLIGGAIVLLVYTVPFLGLLVQKTFDILGIGVVVYTLLLSAKKAKPAAPAAPVAPAPIVPPVVPEGGIAAASGFVGGGAVPMGASAMIPPVASGFAAPAMAAAAPLPGAPAVSAAMLPRAGFWIRVGALLIDVILVGVICAMLPRSASFHGGPPFVLVLLATYGAVMWKLKGTTIGGIVCGLKVVRVDSREVDWATAVVRALGCFLSLIIVGLGFIWVAIDDEKQSWHDKIAGTTVVIVPKGVSLL